MRISLNHKKITNLKHVLTLAHRKLSCIQKFKLHNVNPGLINPGSLIREYLPQIVIFYYKNANLPSQQLIKPGRKVPTYEDFPS